MLVYIGGKLYNSEEVPIFIVMEDKDPVLTEEAEGSYRRYLAHPDELTDDEVNLQVKNAYEVIGGE